MSRDPLDRYYTPPWCTRLLMEVWPDELTGSVWEPCCGAGHMSSVLEQHFETVYKSDADPGAAGETLDFLEATEPPGDVDCIISNPPYEVRRPSGVIKASDFVRQSLAFTPNVAMLLRLAFQEPCQERETIFKLMAPNETRILPRVHYLGPGGGPDNNQTSVWFIWRENLVLPTRTYWWFEEDKARAKGQGELFDIEYQPEKVSRVGADNGQGELEVRCEQE